MMPGREYQAQPSRFGFNGKENDNDVKGFGNQQDYGMRIYDPRIGRFLSVDPLTRRFPYYTPYQSSGNDPIRFIDLDGMEKAFELKPGSGYLVNFHNGFFQRLTSETTNFASSISNIATESSYALSDVLVGGLDWFSGYGDKSRKNLRERWSTFKVNTNKDHLNKIFENVNAALGEYVRNFNPAGTTDEDAFRNGGMLFDFMAILIGEEEVIGLMKTGNFSDDALRALSRAKNKTSSSVQKITNKLPVSTTGKRLGSFQSGEWKMLGRTRADGDFDFVVLGDGTIIIGRDHTFMSGGADVQAAGTLKLRDGTLIRVDNKSGHYVPTVEETEKFLQILKNQGVNVDKTSIITYGENGKKLKEIQATQKKSN